MKDELIIIAGPTATGKSDAGILLAKKIGGEVISCDSMQVYKYMDIGTAKLKKDEMQGVPHHMIDVLDPKENYDVKKFQEMAKKAIKTVYSNGHIPILVGGTGFYIQSLLYDIDFTEEPSDEKIRNKLKEYADKYGADALHEKLKDIDPVSYENIHPNNIKRVIRAIEFFMLHNSPISLHNKEEKKKKSRYDFLYTVLTDDRKRLYDRIDKRVDKMMDMGLLTEVKGLVDYGCNREMTSMHGIGYREFFPYFDGERSLSDTISLIKEDSRHFAKRQLTWFGHERDTCFIDRSYFLNTGNIVEEILNIRRKKHEENRT